MPLGVCGGREVDKVVLPHCSSSPDLNFLPSAVNGVVMISLVLQIRKRRL